MALLDSLDDPDKQALLAMGLGLLAPKQQKTSLLGDIGQSGLLGLQTLGAAKQQERANRQNDLQQLIGLQNTLYPTEFIRMHQMGQAYTPSPEWSGVSNKISQLATNPNMSGKSIPSPAPAAAPPAPSPSAPPGPINQSFSGSSPSFDPSMLNRAPGQAPAPDQAPPSAPQSTAVPGLSSIYGIPALEYMMAARNPMTKAYMDAVVKSREPINARAGSSIGQWDEATQTMKPGFYAPKFSEGVQPSYGPNGQVTAAPVPGYAGAASGIDAAKAGAVTAATEGQKYVEVPIGHNQTMRMTNAQYEAARAAGRLSGSMIPQAVIDADRSGKTFNATQTPDGNVQFQPPSASQVAQVAPIQSPPGSMGGLGVTADPVAIAGAKAGAEGVNKVYGDAYGEIRKAGTDAPYQSALLNEMLALTQGSLKGQTGAFMPMRQKWTEYLTSAGVPQKVIDSLPGTITNLPEAQDFVKLAMQRAMSQTRTMGAREAASVFNQVQQANPNTSLTSDAMARILQPLMAEQDWNQKKFQAADDWLASHQSLAGFESKWQRDNKFTDFWKNSEQAKTASPSQSTVRRYNPATGRIE